MKNLTYLYKVGRGIMWQSYDIMWSQSVYDAEVIAPIFDLPRVDINSLMNGQVREPEAQIRYSTKKEFEILAKRLKIMSDFRVSD